MKRFAGIVFTTVLLIAAVFSCSSMGKNEEQASRNNGSRTGSSERSLLPNGWKYETEITHKGSRSEGSVSRLFYRYNEIPPVFNFIMIGDKVFEYRPMENLWDNYGYIESILPSLTENTMESPVSSAELQRGWYTDAVSRYKAGTPSTWIYAENSGSGLKAWCAPEKINDFIAHFNLNEISGGPSLIGTE